MYEDSNFYTFSPTLIICLFNYTHSNRWSGILLWFWFASPWWLMMLSTFSCAYWPSVYLLWRNSYSNPLLHFKNWIICPSIVGLSDFFIYSFLIHILFFYWSRVDLQCCGNLCSTAKWLSYTQIHSFFNIPFHYGLSQDIEYSSLCYTEGPCCLSILNIIAYIC